MAVPKRRLSRMKVRRRIRANDLRRTYPGVSACPQCGAARQPHRVCAACGYYGKRQVLTVAADE